MAQLGVTLLLSLAVMGMAWTAYGQDDDWNLEDALDDYVPTQKPKPATKPPKIPTRNTDEFDLSDFFDTTKPPKVVPKRPTKKPDVFIPTKKPRGPPVKPPNKPGTKDFDLEDALDDRNDPNRGGDISDSDLEDIVGGGYKPDKGKDGHPAGGRENDNYENSGAINEPGAIAGIASALVMALVGAVSSYISYQQKKFCFSIQQGLNADYVKGENMEAVMAEEPQVKYSSLEAQSAPPPTGDPSKV
ncbi:CD99 antigen-like protein 2 isoform X2 [Hyla sarda]|uniref:CD99 antigen-like protein 2 isoform X2 n=1 Tax=Hyla sarda TaxID=327740 RepID=UPI0024C3CC73|nr:CD99 antigen-like protein 2 isoform X2 [Hyla sarda]